MSLVLNAELMDGTGEEIISPNTKMAVLTATLVVITYSLSHT